MGNGQMMELVVPRLRQPARQKGEADDARVYAQIS